MVERTDRAAVATFYVPGAWAERLELDEGAAHHATVKRLAVGDVVRLSGGDGRRGLAEICELARRRLVVTRHAASSHDVPRPPVIELWAPVSDRERMLLLAEKAVELGVSVWRPVIYRRSRSVSPRGEGETFRDKLRLRMIGALEQCGSAWLPEQHAEHSLEVVLGGMVVTGVNLLLDAAGESLGTLRGSLTAPVRIALGPEGGLDADEREAFTSAGWRTVSLGDNVLRFETAGIAALALVSSFIRDEQ